MLRRFRVELGMTKTRPFQPPFALDETNLAIRSFEGE